MPTTLPENDANVWDSISIPNPLELISIALNSPLNNAFRRLVARTRFARDVLLRENGNPGVKRIRTVSSVANLRALTDHTHADFCALVPASGAPQLFFYSSASGGADDGARTLKPDDVGGPVGRWLDVLRLLADNAGNWLFSGGLKVDGGPLTAEQNFNVNGNADFANAATFNGATSFHGTNTFESGVTLKAGGLLQDALRCSLKGRVRPRQLVVNADANVTVSINMTSSVRLPAGIWTTNRSILIENTGAGEGDELTIFTEDPTRLVVVSKASDFSDILPEALKDATGSVFSVLLTYSGGEWVKKSWSRR